MCMCMCGVCCLVCVVCMCGGCCLVCMCGGCCLVCVNVIACTRVNFDEYYKYE